MEWVVRATTPGNKKGQGSRDTWPARASPRRSDVTVAKGRPAARSAGNRPAPSPASDYAKSWYDCVPSCPLVRPPKVEIPSLLSASRSQTSCRRTYQAEGSQIHGHFFEAAGRAAHPAKQSSPLEVMPQSASRFSFPRQPVTLLAGGLPNWELTWQRPCWRNKNAGRNQQFGAFMTSEVTQTCTFPATSTYSESDSPAIRLAANQ
jgi:hypothetical protein